MVSSLKPDDRISRYRIISPLGAGGMGEVYRARDESLGRDIALKVLPPLLVRSDDRLRRFVLEAKSASSLNHPNIVTIYEVGVEQVVRGEERGLDKIHFISMELIEGSTLSTRIHNEKKDLRTLLMWLAQAAAGLAKAHAAGIVHRDLKPGNIMISKDGYAKVLDFGLAKLTEKHLPEPEMTSAPTETADRTDEGVVLGTAGYMSPEQVQGKPVDHRSDIFSFGCILYEAATGTRPFSADTTVETMAKILKETPTPIEQLNPQAPAELRRLIRRCLAKDPNQRLDSMRALDLELREIVEDYEELSAPGSGKSVAMAAPVGRPAMLIVALCLVTLIVSAVALTGLWRKTPAGQATRVDGSLRTMRIATVTNRGDISTATLSPDGRNLAYVCGTIGRYALRVRQLATETDVELAAALAGPPESLSYSRDGTYLFYEIPELATPQRNSVLYQISSLGGPARRREIRSASPVSFSPDGRRICFLRRVPGQKGTSLIVLDLQNGLEKTLTAVRSPLLVAPPLAWSPDGSRIATIETVQDNPRGAVQSTIVTFSVDEEKRDTIGSDVWNGVFSLIWEPDGTGLLTAAIDADSAYVTSQIWRIRLPDGEARRVTNDFSSYSELSLSPDGKTIAAIGRNAIANLWTAEADSSQPARQLTSASNWESSVIRWDSAQDGGILFMRQDQATVRRIEPDGSGERTVLPIGRYSIRFFGLPRGGILFSRFGDEAGGHLRVVDADGINDRQLSDFPGGEFLQALSPDGNRALLSPREHREELWIVGTAGTTPMQLTASVRPTVVPDFSPDGARIVYPSRQSAPGQVWTVIESERGEAVQSVNIPLTAHDVEWTPDARSLTFLDRSNGAPNVFRVRLDGGITEQVTHFSDGDTTDHEWSKTSGRLLLSRRTEHDNLWLAAPDGSHAVPLTRFESGRLFNMDWMPDGRRIVFSYGEERTDVVLIRNFE